MTTQEKYKPVIDILQEHGENIKTSQEKDSLKVDAVVNTQYEKDLVWDKIKQVGGENPSDIKADIKVKDPSIFALHKVQKGETLSYIAKKYYGDAGKFRQIASYNNISNPDKLNIGQVIKIPNK